MKEQRLADVFLERAVRPEWRNTLSFLFGRLLSASTEPKKALDLLHMHIDGASESDTDLLLVVIDAAEMLTGKGIILPSDRLSRLRDLFCKVMFSGRAAFTTRENAGSALGRLGDPRFRTDRLWLPNEDLLGFVRVEAGGLGRVATRAGEQQRVELSDYYISRYPVTVAQFRAFIDDSRFEVHDPVCLRGVPNHPVVRVSFYEALAYAEWLTDRLRRAEWTPRIIREQLARGWAVKLPSGAEWEKAARGPEGRIYPWGDKFDASKANGHPTGLSATTAVGVFPDVSAHLKPRKSGPAST